MPKGPLHSWSEMNYANYSPSSSLNYPSPFLNFESYSIPKSLKEIFSFAFHSYLTDSNINPAIEKLAAYPLTSIIYKSQIDKNEKKVWNYIFNNVLEIRNFLYLIGLDFLLYGNALGYLFVPFKRYIHCAKCKGNKRDINQPNVNWEWKNNDFHYHCPDCGLMKAIVEDAPIGTIENNSDVKKHVKDFRLRRFNIFNIRIEEHEITGKKTYYYKLSETMKARVLKGEKDYINETPIRFIQVIQAHIKKRKNCEIKLDNDKIKGLHRPMPSSPEEGLSGWGLPIVICSLRDIFFKNVMRRAQAVVLNEHIVPFRIFSPITAGNDPLDLSLATWKEEITENLLLWRKNPQHIMTSPIPIEAQQIGGQGKALSMASDIDQSDYSIIKGLGTPREFVIGGLTWSGSSMSLRMLENGMTYQIENFEDIMNWSAETVSDYISLKAPEVGLKPFKSADDSQEKQGLMALFDRKLVSPQTMLSSYDLDWDDEMEKLNSSAEKTSEYLAKIEVISTKYNVRAQQYIQNNLQPKAFDIFQNPLNPAMMQQLFDQFKTLDPNSQNKTMENLSQQNPAAADVINNKMKMSPQMIMQMIMENQQLPPELAAQKEMDLYNNDKETFLMYQYVKLFNSQPQQPQPLPQHNFNNQFNQPQQPKFNQPLPEQRPPRRDNSPV